MNVQTSFSTRAFKAVCFFFCAIMIISRFWVAEDAYITFRVVENLFAGLGLVYNPGENVETFTHPLWMLCLVLIKSLGFPLHIGSVLLGFTLAMLALGRLIYRKGVNTEHVFPIAALALCALSGFRDFATAGMEFTLVFFLLTLLFTDLEKDRLSERPFYFASLLALLYLTRPELALLVVYYSAFILYEVYKNYIQPDIKEVYGAGPNPPLKRRLLNALPTLLAWAAPILLFAGGYHLFRALYYNDIFPNTYYAKSGGGAYFSQGIKYFLHTLVYAPPVLLLGALALLLPLLNRFRGLMPPKDFYPYVREAGVIFLLTFYVMRVGGDFMSFRFLLPEITMLALLVQRFFQYDFGLSPVTGDGTDGNKLRLAGQSGLPLAIAGLLVFIALSFFPAPLNRGYIADERQIFTTPEKGEARPGPIELLFSQNHKWGKVGADLRKLQSCLAYDDFWITNSQFSARCLKGIGLGYFGVAAGGQVKILDEQALPNREVAIMPVITRYRPGHEHYADLSLVIDKGAIFCSSGEPAYDRIMATKAGIVIRLDPELLASLPDIKNRLTKLLVLKKEGSPIISRLERRYNVRIEDLLKEADAWEIDMLMRAKYDCWNDYNGGPERYFY